MLGKIIVFSILSLQLNAAKGFAKDVVYSFCSAKKCYKITAKTSQSTPNFTSKIVFKNFQLQAYKKDGKKFELERGIHSSLGILDSTSKTFISEKNNINDQSLYLNMKTDYWKRLN